MKVTVINSDNFVEEVMQADKPVLVDFYADWCGPCKMLMPTVHELAEERDDIKICKVNVDDCPDIARAFDVSVIPTLVALKDGGVLGVKTGVQSKSEILKLLGV